MNQECAPQRSRSFAFVEMGAVLESGWRIRNIKPSAPVTEVYFTFCLCFVLFFSIENNFLSSNGIFVDVCWRG